MKKSDIELIIDRINDIKDFTNTLDFNTSRFINQQVIQIMPILKSELDRLDDSKITINSPRLLAFCAKDINSEQSLIDFANNKMSELVENNYKILDFGLYEGSEHNMYVYIKYTN